MTARLKLLGVLLRKDLRLFWLFAALTAVLSVAAPFDGLWEQMEELASFIVYPAFVLTSGLLTLLVFHEDSAVSGTRDWLTRPVPPMTQLAAKCVFVLLVILLPMTLGTFLNGMHQGFPPGEALVSSFAENLFGGTLEVMLGAMAVAALTANIRQATVALVVGVIIVGPGSALLSLGFRNPDDSVIAAGSEWLRTRTLACLATLTSLAVLWILYRRRHGRRAALVLVGLAVLAGGTWHLTMNGTRSLALQQWLSPDPAAASSVAVSVLPGCFPARTLDDSGEATASTPAQIPVWMFPLQQRERAGADAVAFAVRLIVDRLPEDGQLLLSRTQLTYKTADGAKVSLGTGRTSEKWVMTESGQRAIDQYWLLPRATYERLAAAPGTTAHFDHSLSLLNTSAAAVFAADGRRAYRAGIGYCGATVSPVQAQAYIDCYRAGDQPALLAARLDGHSDIEDRASGVPDFTPAILDFGGGHRHHMVVSDAATSQIRVTAYEARAHFTRQFEVPGVLGGPASSCPLP